MADSIHDQWPQATGEWQDMTALFNAAWIGVNAAYGVNPQYAAIAAAISYLARLHEDTTVMEGDMLTHVAQAGQDGFRGVIQNFQQLQGNVLPQWGQLAAAYAEARAAAWTAHEASNRITADETEQAARAAGDLALSNQVAAGDAHEAQLRALGDAAILSTLNTLLQQETAQLLAGDDLVRSELTTLVNQDVAILAAQIGTLQAYAQSIPGLIDSRAAAGYDPTIRGRSGLFGKLLDTAAAHEPLIAGLVSKLATALVDLLEVDDPLIRVAAQLILKQLIDKLGVDTALHQMLGDLLGSLFGGGPPKTLQAVCADIGNRLDALEASVANLSPLAPEADDLHEMGTLIFDAALVGYLTAAVADPVATANDTVDVLAPILTPLLGPVRALLGMP